MHSFKKNVIDQYGEQGKAWLRSLTTITTELTEQYRLSDLQPVTNMSFNYVASGFQHKKSIMLKLGLNDHALAKEAACLKAFDQHGAVEVIASERGMILMACARPGTTLKEYFPDKDHQAVPILCKIIRQLHTATIPNQSIFFHLKEVLSILDNDLDIPREVLSKARMLRDNLLATTRQTVLLHGDLHHENILKHADEWLVIDPKGFIGDPVFELCAFIHNPVELLKQANPIEIINHRIKSCAELLGYPEQRIQHWLYVKSVLCWAWCLDDNIQPTYFKQFLGLLDQ